MAYGFSRLRALVTCVYYARVMSFETPIALFTLPLSLSLYGLWFDPLTRQVSRSISLLIYVKFIPAALLQLQRSTTTANELDTRELASRLPAVFYFDPLG